MVKITFSTANEAFDAEDGEPEITRILGRITVEVELGKRQGITIDRNGNIVGKWSYTQD